LTCYDIGDRVMWLDAPCPCGNAFPAIRVEGRSDEVLQMEDGTGRAIQLLPLAVETALETQGEVYRFQVVRTCATSLALRVEARGPQCAHTQQRALEALVSFLKEQGLANVRVDLEECPIERSEASGKLQRVVTARERTHASRRAATTALIGSDAAPG